MTRSFSYLRCACCRKLHELLHPLQSSIAEGFDLPHIFLNKPYWLKELEKKPSRVLEDKACKIKW